MYKLQVNTAAQSFYIKSYKYAISGLGLVTTIHSNLLMAAINFLGLVSSLVFWTQGQYSSLVKDGEKVKKGRAQCWAVSKIEN